MHLEIHGYILGLNDFVIRHFVVNSSFFGALRIKNSVDNGPINLAVWEIKVFNISNNRYIDLKIQGV